MPTLSLDLMTFSLAHPAGALTLLLALFWGGLAYTFARAARRALRQPDTPDPGLPRPAVSVVIAARNEADTIGGLLRSLLAVDWPRDRLEIIVADDRSTDATAAEIDAVAAESGGIVRRLAIDRVPAGWTPKKWALQTAVDSAGGEIVLTTDADCRVGPEWIERLTAPLRRADGPELCGGPVDYAGAVAWRWPKRLLRVEFFSLSVTAAGSLAAGLPLVISAQNMAFTRDLFRRCGGYEPHAAIPSGDDVFLLFAADAAGIGTGYVLEPGAVVTTRAPASWAEFYHQRTRWASKGLRYPRRPRLVSALVWLVNASLLLSVAAAALGCGALWPWAAAGLVLKGLGEIALLRLTKRFGLKHLGIDYLTGVPLHLIYVTLFGAVGALGLFRWKEST